MNIANPLLDYFRRSVGKHSFKGATSFCEYLQTTKLYEDEYQVIDNFDNLVEELREWLNNKGFRQAELLMDLTLSLNEGNTRQDGVTPSALHEITQALWFISCLEDGLYAEDVEGVLSVIFAHDLGEDFNKKPEELEAYLLGSGISSSEKLEQFKIDFDVISKCYGKNGDLRHGSIYEYYLAIQKSANASIAKQFDRAHNIMTLIGVKDKGKILDYTFKTMQLQNDFIRDVSNNFPEQEKIYKNLDRIIRQEIQVCSYYAVDTGKRISDDSDINLTMPECGFKNLPLGLHPLIVAARRVRKTYPTTQNNNNFGDNDIELS